MHLGSNIEVTSFNIQHIKFYLLVTNYLVSVHIYISQAAGGQIKVKRQHWVYKK